MQNTPLIKRLEIERKVKEKFIAGKEKARAKGFPIDEITLEFFYKGSAAGWYMHGKRLVKINIGLAATSDEAFDHVLNHTVEHELSHGVSSKYMPASKYDSKPHGSNWKYAMRYVFGLAPTRCHSLDVSQVARKHDRPFIYVCKCREFKLTKRMHTTILQGQKRCCPKCRNTIVFKEITT
jgi:SprT protein